MLKPSDVMWPPDEETLKRMLLDLNEDPDRLKTQIELFKEWLKCESYLPNNVDDQLIIHFIRHCKCDLVKAKKKFVNYLALRDKFQSCYSSPDLSEDVNKIAIHKLIVICPQLTPEGYRIGCMRLPKKVSQFDFMKTFHFLLILIDFVLHENICGAYVGIYDFKNLSAQHLGKLNFKYLAEAIDIVYSAGPFRIKALHIVNAPSIPDTLAALLKKLVPQKIIDRVYFHKSTSSLKEYFTPDLIPKEYGGDSFDCDELSYKFKDFFCENRDWMKKLAGLRLTGPIPNRKQELYSFEDYEMGGSFRKLAID